MFIAPGLYKHEKRYVIPFTVLSALFFIGGAAFGYFVVFPFGFQFFLGFAQKNVASMQEVFGSAVNLTLGKGFELKPTLMMGEYFGLVWRLLLAFGVIFELPLLIVFLSMVGLVTHRKLWKWNPYFVVLAFVVSAVLTPPDVVTQILMALPLIALYNISILFAWHFTRRREKATS
jgi:sec-independent protein translocase protein TatC